AKMNRLVALKILRKELVANPEALSRFQREVQVISRLDHPHIVHAFDAGPMGPVHGLAMEFVDGVNLSRLVQQNWPLPPPQACDFVRQAALGLQYAHERGLVHRDIKPSNLIVSSVKDEAGLRNVVKIVDLGLARLHRGKEDGGSPRPDANSDTLT